VSIEARDTQRGTVYDVRLRTPDGRAYKRTFRTRKEAVDFEAAEITRRAQGEWVDQRAGKIPVRDFCERWLAQRPDLRPRTRELYGGNLRKHILPVLGDRPVGQLRISDIRAWYAGMLDAGVRQVVAAKCYRLLRTILGTAVEDGIIGRNPCAIRAAGVERSPERPVATLAQVEALANAVDDQYRAMVLLGTFCGLRLGELLALTRKCFDLDECGEVKVSESLLELSNGRIGVGPPKSDAGNRSVAIPPHLIPVIADHLESWVGPDPDDIVFRGQKGGWLRRSQWNKYWLRACGKVGVQGLRFHDLRHTGNTLAASTGASTRELMKRLGHSSPKAALRYQHATRERDVEIAVALSDLVQRAAETNGRTATNDGGCAIDVPWQPSESESPEAVTTPEQGVEGSGRRGSNPHHQLGSLFDPYFGELRRCCTAAQNVMHTTANDSERRRLRDGRAMELIEQAERSAKFAGSGTRSSY
jgi:integrase